MSSEPQNQTLGDASAVTDFQFCVSVHKSRNTRNSGRDCKTRRSSLSPGQTIATCQRDISQHVELIMLCAFGHRVATCCDMWGVVGSTLTIFKLSPQHPTCRNTVAKRTQHVSPNNVPICSVGMLRSFGRGFKWEWDETWAWHERPIPNSAIPPFCVLNSLSLV